MIHANYEFLEHQKGEGSLTKAKSTINPNDKPSIETIESDWSQFSSGLNLPGNKKLEMSSDYTLDLSTSFSMEIWFRSYTEGTILAVIPESQVVTQCPSNALFYLRQTEAFVDSFHGFIAEKDGNCLQCRWTDDFRTNLPEKGTGRVHQIVMTYDASSEDNYPLLYSDGILGEANNWERHFLKNPNRGAFGGLDPNRGACTIQLSPDDDWSGEIFKLAFYNKALSADEVKTTRACLANSIPYAPHITQHILEDTLSDIQLNGQPYNPQSAMIPWGSDYVQNSADVKQVQGQVSLSIGSQVYDIIDEDFTFRILTKPKALKFNINEQPVILDQTYHTNSTLQFQSLPDENSWQYNIGQSRWEFESYDQFTYQVNDGKDWSNVATFTIIVDPKPDPPVPHDLQPINVQAGDITRFVLKGNQTKDTFSQVAAYETDTLIVTKLPTYGNLEYCSSMGATGRCEYNCANWQQCTLGSKIAGVGKDKEPCFKYNATLDQSQLTNGDNSGIMYVDTIKFKMIYTGDPLFFIESARTGQESTVSLNAGNPLNAKGDAPFDEGGKCTILEDVKSPFSLNKIISQGYRDIGESIQIKIKPLPQNFRGTLFIGDEEMGKDVEKIIEEGTQISYKSEENDYTDFTQGEQKQGYTFDFSILGNVNGNSIESIVGTQKICIEKQNDKPNILNMKFQSPMECCSVTGNEKYCEWNNGTLWEESKTSIESVTNGERRTMIVPIQQCLRFSVEWTDVDADPGAMYEVELTNANPDLNSGGVPEKKIGFYLPPALLYSTPSQVEILNIVDGQNDALIRFKASYAIVKQALGDLKLKTKAFGKQEISITITDKSSYAPTNLESVSMSKVTIDISDGVVKSGKTEDGEEQFWEFWAQFGMYVMYGGLALCCCCCFSGSWMCWKRVKKSNFEKARKQMANQSNSNYGAGHGGATLANMANKL